jgi:hypothetical protein
MVVLEGADVWIYIIIGSEIAWGGPKWNIISKFCYVFR